MYVIFIGGHIGQPLPYDLVQSSHSSLTTLLPNRYLDLFWVSVIIGRKLPQLEYNNQRVEAAFRKSLVRCEDNKDSHALEHLYGQFRDLKYNYYKLYDNYKYYSLWENLYSQTGVVIPYLVVAPQYFAGAITLGTLVQIGNAFGKIHESMSFFTDNWLTVTELRSVVRRLNEFEQDIK